VATNSQLTDLAFEDLYGVHAIDEKQQLERTAGFGIISGGEVSASGADSYTVSVTEATGQFGFVNDEPNTVTAPATDKDLLPYVDDTQPRKVLICLEDTGSIAVVAGEPEDARPESALETEQTGETPSYFKTERPAPPDLLGRGDLLPLARIWLGANTSEVKPEHIRPSRVAVDITTRSIRGETADFSVFDDGAGVSHTDELADAADIRTDSEIKSVINDDPYHSENADHDYWTASDTLSTVNGEDVLTVSVSGDADTVDGFHATELSKTGHNHDARYLLDQNGTVTVGNLAFDPFTQAEYQASLPEVVATVPVTLVGGQLQAVKETITGVQSAVDSDFEVEVNLTGDPGFDAGYTYEWDRTWDTSDGTWTVEVVVTWADTPAGGNDADAEIRIVERGDTATPLSVEDESINPRSIGQQTPTEAITAENVEVRGDVVSQSTDTGELSTNTNLSMRRPLGRVYQGAAVANDGTHYALYHDGSDLVLHKGATPQTFTEQYRWAAVSDAPKRTLHITQNGSILATGMGGAIERSTDGGSSFTQVGTFGTSVWTISEASNGDLVMNPNGSDGTVEIYQSTDDGQSWSLIADGTTLSEFGRHVHRVRYLPNSGYIVATGGDSGTNGFYRSTDNGSSWDYYDPLQVQWVGICGHPNDGNTYFLGGDDDIYGPIAKISDDGASVSATPVHYPVLEDQPPNNKGSFDITALQQADGTGAYVLVGAGDSQPHLWVSDSFDGNSWRSLGPTEKGSYQYIYDQTTQQGPNETTIDVSSIDSVVFGGTHTYCSPALDHHYGTHSEQAVDKRPAHGKISFNEDGGLLWNRKIDVSDVLNLIDVDPSDSDRMQVRADNGKFNFRNFDTLNRIFQVDFVNERVNVQESPLINRSRHKAV